MAVTFLDDILKLLNVIDGLLDENDKITVLTIQTVANKCQSVIPVLRAYFLEKRIAFEQLQDTGAYSAKKLEKILNELQPMEDFFNNEVFPSFQRLIAVSNKITPSSVKLRDMSRDEQTELLRKSLAQVGADIKLIILNITRTESAFKQFVDSGSTTRGLLSKVISVIKPAKE